MKDRWPLAGLAIISILFLINQVFTQRAPHISALDPPVVSPGQELVIRGEYFGNDPSNAGLLISGVTVTKSHILFWSDREIRIKLFDSLESGLVTLETKEGSSPGVLLTNRKDLPILVSSLPESTGPAVFSVSPGKVRPGDQVVLTGKAFGESTRTGSISLLWGPERELTSPESEESLLMLSDQEIDFWSDREVRFRVPSGVRTGPLYLTSPSGESKNTNLEVDDSALNRVYHSRNIFSLSYSFDVVINKAGDSSSLLIWVPRPLERANQRNFKITHQSQEPFLSIPSMDLYKYEGLSSGARWRVSRDFMVEVYAQEVKLKPELMGNSYDLQSSIYTENILEDLWIPTQSVEIISMAQKAGGTEYSPYHKAVALYRYLLGSFKLDLSRESRDPLGSLKVLKANSYELAIIYTSLCRALKIPARPISGYLLTSPKALKDHFWVEIYLPGAGWIPVDPALASGLKYGVFPEVPDVRTFYFGNLFYYNYILVQCEKVGIVCQLTLFYLKNVRIFLFLKFSVLVQDLFHNKYYQKLIIIVSLNLGDF